MAFYKDVPEKIHRKTNYAGTGSWDEEGTHYSDRKPSSGRRFGPSSSEGRSFRNNEYRGHSDDRRSDRSSSFGSRHDDRRGTDRREAAPAARSYRDHEYHEAERPGRSDRRPAPEARSFERKPAAERRPAMDRRPAPAFRAYEEQETPENLLTGRNPIREALKSGRDIEKLLVQKGELSGSAREIVQKARELHVIVQEVEKARLDELAPHHQGMIAYASAYQYSTIDAMLEEAAEKNEAPFLILLDGVTDPHNLGAIIRSAECVGAHGVIVPERRSVGLTPAAVKASAGAIEHMKVARVINLNRTIEDLQKKGVWAYALTMDGEDYEKVNFEGGVALVVGAEGEGVSRLTLETCDQKVSLPMKGAIDSLNASVAAGIVMYRVLSSRSKA